MKKNLLIIIGGVVVAIGLIFALTYNKIVKASEDVESASSTISVQLQRRADLIPNLISVVKGYTSHERDTIDSIVEARSNLLSAKTMSEKAEANEKLNTVLDSLTVIVENYPELKANQNFINVQDELAGTENRISTARTDYNNSVKKYNQIIKTFPNNLLAKLFNFEKKDYYEAKESSKEVPNVSFE